MLENIEFTLTEEEYAFLLEHFEAESQGLLIDYIGGHFFDILDRALGIIQHDEEAMADYLRNNGSLCLLLWYLYHYQDSHGIARTFFVKARK